MTRQLTQRQAAQLSVSAQLLGNRARHRPTPDDVRRVVDRLACIQIDTISVVARSHYIVLWSRLGGYEPEWLDQLQFPERRVFEYWGHAASFIDISMLPYFLSRMEERRHMYHPDRYDWARDNRDLFDSVRQLVRQHGPLTSLAFERPNPDEPVEPWAWYGGKPTNRVFDHLWLSGELAVRRRINFRRELDLFERVHPEVLEMSRPDPVDERRALAERALVAMGVCRPEWLNDYFRTKWGTRNDRPPGPLEILDDLVAAGRAIPVEIKDLGAAYVSVDHATLLDEVLQGYTATRTTLLSPFDNLIWDRKRTLELFGFAYRIEIYTPAHKRQYGYFTLPILRRGRLIGRLDPKVDRRTGEFQVKSLHLEPGIRTSNALIGDVAAAVASFARWNGASTVVCQDAPGELAEAISGDLPAGVGVRKAKAGPTG